MRICCGLIGNLELGQRQDLYGSPVIVGDWEVADDDVIAVSEEALPFGVMPGMPLRQAEHLCPQATFVPPNPVAATRLRDGPSRWRWYDLGGLTCRHSHSDRAVRV